MQIVSIILILLSQLIRFLGLGALGIGFGWLALDLLKKLDLWQAKIAIFLGLIGLIIAMTVFAGWGAQGLFFIGFSVAIFLWAMPKKEKKLEEEKQ
jgi:FtsH-binding integral membrane protein